MTTEAVPDSAGAIPAAGGVRTWDDTYQETPFDPSGQKSGNQWEDWGKVMYQAIAPPLGCIEEVLHRTPLHDPLDQAEVNVLWPLMIEEITCPASQYNLELRFLHREIRIVTEVLRATTGVFEDDEMLALDPEDWSDYGSLLYSVPLTREDCAERLDKIQGRIRVLHQLIDHAKAEGAFYDVCGLIDWFATPPEYRSTNSPSHVLAHFGKLLFGVLGVAAQNTQWAHIEAVTSRQIAPRFGGDYRENEITRHRNNVPGRPDPNPLGVASNAPR